MPLYRRTIPLGEGGPSHAIGRPAQIQFAGYLLAGTALPSVRQRFAGGMIVTSDQVRQQ